MSSAWTYAPYQRAATPCRMVSPGTGPGPSQASSSMASISGATAASDSSSSRAVSSGDWPPGGRLLLGCLLPDRARGHLGDRAHDVVGHVLHLPAVTASGRVPVLGGQRSDELAQASHSVRVPSMLRSRVKSMPRD